MNKSLLTKVKHKGGVPKMEEGAGDAEEIQRY